jgi:hypothetical protein
MTSTFFGLLAEFGEANIPLDKIAPKYFGLSPQEARRRASQTAAVQSLQTRRTEITLACECD